MGVLGQTAVIKVEWLGKNKPQEAWPWARVIKWKQFGLHSIQQLSTTPLLISSSHKPNFERGNKVEIQLQDSCVY